MVAMGEYSDACVCSVPGQDKGAVMDSAGPVSGASGGVIMQMRRQQASASRAR